MWLMLKIKHNRDMWPQRSCQSIKEDIRAHGQQNFHPERGKLLLYLDSEDSVGSSRKEEACSWISGSKG